MVGRRHGAAPCSAVQETAASLQCLQPERATKAELNRRSQACEVLTDTGSRREKWTSIRVSLPVEAASARPQGVYLSTPMLEEMESRAGIAPASAVLQTAA